MNRFASKTLTGDAAFEGLGLHSGEPVRAVVHPGEKGLFFRAGRGRWEATPENVTDTSRCTRLGDVSTIEHLMAALAATGVTDAEVEVAGGELPALDGAARAFCDGIVAVGTQQIGECELSGPFARVFHHEGEVKIAIAHGDGLWRYEYELGERWPHSQHFEFSFATGDFLRDVAPARTFALAEELDYIKQHGLGNGLNETNAFVIEHDHYRKTSLFSDEPARHKLLDLVGDLYLSGVPPRLLSVVAQRSGHKTNVVAAQKLREHVTIE